MCIKIIKEEIQFRLFFRINRFSGSKTTREEMSPAARILTTRDYARVNTSFRRLGSRLELIVPPLPPSRLSRMLAGFPLVRRTALLADQGKGV